MRGSAKSETKILKYESPTSGSNHWRKMIAKTVKKGRNQAPKREDT